jgi:hypothetical protein
MAELYELHEAIEAVCPIYGVDSNKRINFKPTATVSQRDAAQAVAEAFDFAAPSNSDAVGARRFEGMDKTEKAILLLLRSYSNALVAGTQTTKTIQQLKTDFVTAWKAIP